MKNKRLIAISMIVIMVIVNFMSSISYAIETEIKNDDVEPKLEEGISKVEDVEEVDQTQSDIDDNKEDEDSLKKEDTNVKIEGNIHNEESDKVLDNSKELSSNKEIEVNSKIMTKSAINSPTVKKSPVPVQSIEDGEYEIRSFSDSKKVLDIDGGSTANCAKLQIWDDDDVTQQRFMVKYLGDGYYKLTVRKSGKVLDVQGASTIAGAAIQQYESNNTDAQEWIIYENREGLYSITSKCNNLSLSIKNNNISCGSKIVVEPFEDKENQLFIFDKVVKDEAKKTVNDGEYEIRTVNDSKVLDIDGGSVANCAKLQIWDDADVTQQRFILEYDGNGFYTIKVNKSQKVLDVVGGSIKENAGVQQYESNNTDAQKWIIKEYGDGYYGIVSKCSGYSLSISNSSYENGSKIIVKKENDTDVQKFKFDKVLKAEAVKTIEDGEYEIRSAKNTNKILDIDGGSIENCAKLQVWEDDEVTQQRFNVKYIGNGYYQIKVRKSGKSLDVQGGSIKENTSIQQYESNNTDAQKWIIEDCGDGTYSIVSKCNGLCLTISNESVSNGSKVFACKDNKNETQKFIFTKINREVPKKTIESGEYKIRCIANEKKVLDIDGGSTENYAKLQIWEQDDVSQQRFFVTHIGNGLYEIKVKKSSKALDVPEGSLREGSGVQQFTPNGTEAQRWIIKERGDNTYSIISSCNDFYMTYDISSNGCPILLKSCDDSENQIFKFDKIREETGIDVSEFQGTIDWKKVKNSGIDFAYIRVGYRGYGSGKIVYDSKFQENIRNATANGVKCGVYFYTQAINEAEAIEEANFVIDAIRGFNVEYPIVIDTEYATASKTGRADRLSVDERTKACVAFCEQVKKRGYTPMVYASKFWFYDNLDMKRINNYKVWLAHYITNAPEKKSDYKYDYLVWQYTSTGKVDGISGNVDIDIQYNAR